MGNDQKHVATRETSPSSFADLLDVWLHRRFPDAHTCFCIQYIMISHVVEFLENTTVFSWENESENGKKHHHIIMKIGSQGPPNRTLGTP